MSDFGSPGSGTPRTPRQLAIVLTAITALLGAIALLAPQPVTKPEAAATSMKIQEVKSPGGIEAWLVEEHSVPLMALRFVFDGGNAQDPAGKEGLAEFPAGMLDEGAGDLDPTQFQERMEELAISMSFEDGRDAFYGSFETLTANREPALDLLRLALNKPRFDADAVERVSSSCSPASPSPRKIPTASPAKRGALRPSPAIPTAARPTARRRASPRSPADDLETFRKRIVRARHAARRGRRRHRLPRTLGALLDKVFGDLPAKAELTPVAGDRAEADREAQGHRDGRAAVGGAVRHDRAGAQGQGLHGGVRAQPDPRRRRLRLAADRGGAREARPRLLGLQLSAALQARRDLRRRRRHQERGGRAVARRDPRRVQAHGRRRPDRDGAGQRQELPDRLVRAALRHQRQDRQPAAVDAAGGAGHRLRREAQRAGRRGDAGRHEARGQAPADGRRPDRHGGRQAQGPGRAGG